MCFLSMSEFIFQRHNQEEKLKHISYCEPENQAEYTQFIGVCNYTND